MNWPRTLLDGALMCIVFNVSVALLWTFIPGAFARMMPPEIRKAAPKPKRRELVILASVMIPMYFLILLYVAGSARLAGVEGFRALFWTCYVEMIFVNFGDLFFLDGFFRGWVRRHCSIPGTEHCDAWNLKPWMRTLALPEHLLLWPLVACPLCGLLCAWLGGLM